MGGNVFSRSLLGGNAAGPPESLGILGVCGSSAPTRGPVFPPHPPQAPAAAVAPPGKMAGAGGGYGQALAPGMEVTTDVFWSADTSH